jgi:hypothetical protein
MSKKQKHPWNPFPLAVLDVEGISRGAKHVLTVLAARSNYKGETCVGHRRLTKDCQSSKQYVTDALKELYEKKLVSESPRNRQKRQADWKIISPVVLQARTMQNPTEQDDAKSYPVGHHNPTEQDFNNPTQQGRTLQIKKNPNLADENLADSSVSQSFSQGTGVPQAETEEKDKDNPLRGFTAEEREAVLAVRKELGYSGEIPAFFGIPYFHVGHDSALTRIAAELYIRNRSVAWLAQLVFWAKGGDPKDRESKFWKGKLQTGDKAVEKLAEFLETGTIAEQYDAKLVLAHGSGAFDALRENQYLLRTFPHLKAKAHTAPCGFDIEEA